MNVVWGALLGALLSAYVTVMGLIAWDTYKGYRELARASRPASPEDRPTHP